MEPIARQLTLVRERLGRSQKEVAARLGVSASLVSKWEKGERKPDIAQVWELSRVFGVSPYFLERARRVVTFRTGSQTARGVGDKSAFGEVLNDAAQQIHNLYDVWERAGKVPARFPLALEYAEEGLARQARMVRDCLRLNGKVIYAELREALAEQNVLVFEWKLPAKISGLSHQADFSVIFINRDMPERVKLFTLCHELGHLLYHLRGSDDSTVSVMATRSDPHEKEANRFAAELLMPAERINALVAIGRNSLKSKTGFLAAAENFGVSKEAMFYRLSQSPWQVFSHAEQERYFKKTARTEHETGQLGARVTEVREQLPPPLLQLSTQLWLDGEVTLGKVAELCLAARSRMDLYLVGMAEDAEPPGDDVILGLAEVDGIHS